MILDRAVGCFNGGDNRFRFLNEPEIHHILEATNAALLRAAGILNDPFTSAGQPGHRQYRIVAAPEPDDDTGDPFSVTRQVEDELIPWDDGDRQQAEAAFRAARRDTLDAGLDATDRFLAARSPFKVTVT